MNILIYKDATALSEVNGKRLKSKTKPLLSFNYDELYYTPTKELYTLDYEERALSKEQIEEIEAFIENIQENRELSLIHSLQEYLQKTDWLVIRELETGKKMPPFIKEERAKTRAKLHKLKG